MTRLTEVKVYSDANLSFIPHPMTGNVPPLINVDAINQSIRNLFRLNPGDIPFDPRAFTNLEQYLFDNITLGTIHGIKKHIEWMINEYEKRVKLYKVDIQPTPEENGFDVTITFRIKALNYDSTLTEYFRRVR